jgi:hypothetical protein
MHVTTSLARQHRLAEHSTHQNNSWGQYPGRYRPQDHEKGIGMKATGDGRMAMRCGLRGSRARILAAAAFGAFLVRPLAPARPLRKQPPRCRELGRRPPPPPVTDALPSTLPRDPSHSLRRFSSWEFSLRCCTIVRVNDGSRSRDDRLQKHRRSSVTSLSGAKPYFSASFASI